MAGRQGPSRRATRQRQSLPRQPRRNRHLRKSKRPSKSGAQQSLPLNDVAALENIRRANLHVLTSRKGSKVRLGAVMEISASNMANRFYGQKRMDDAEANRFTERLGLPTGWLDVPRSVTDIPESVSDLLDPPSRRPCIRSARTTSPRLSRKRRWRRKSAGTKAKTAGARLALPSDADAQRQRASPLRRMRSWSNWIKLLPSASDPAIRQTVDNDVPFSAAHQQFAPASVTQVIAEPRRSASVTSLDDLLGIEPIAEALIKTLAGKARTGRLDEMKALELLRQIVSL